jgi:hypothetical protein
MAAALGEPQWLHPPQRAPNVLRMTLSDPHPDVHQEKARFIARCEQAEAKELADFHRHWEEAVQEYALHTDAAIQRMLLGTASALRTMDNKQTGVEYAGKEANLRLDDEQHCHLSSSSAAILGPRHWLAPPQRAPERGTPDRASYVATYALAQYDAVVLDRAIQILQARLAQDAKNAEHTQRTQTARSAALAEWQRQEDDALATALAKEADMQCRHDDDLRMITDGFMIDLESM